MFIESKIWHHSESIKQLICSRTDLCCFSLLSQTSVEVMLNNILHVTEICLQKLATSPQPLFTAHTHTRPPPVPSTAQHTDTGPHHLLPASDVDLPHVDLRWYGLHDLAHPTFDPVHAQHVSLQLQLQVDTILDGLVPAFKHFPPGERRRHRGHGVVLPPRHALLHSLHAQVEQLHHAEHQGDHRRHQHEPDDDRLLRGPGEEAVHLVRAGVGGADVARLEGETVEIVLTHDKQNLQDYLGHQMEGVAAEEAAADADLAGALRVLGNFVGLTEEQVDLGVQLRLLLHPLFHLRVEEREDRVRRLTIIWWKTRGSSWGWTHFVPNPYSTSTFGFHARTSAPLTLRGNQLLLGKGNTWHMRSIGC